MENIVRIQPRLKFLYTLHGIMKQLEIGFHISLLFIFYGMEEIYYDLHDMHKYLLILNFSLLATNILGVVMGIFFHTQSMLVYESLVAIISGVGHRFIDSKVAAELDNHHYNITAPINFGPPSATYVNELIAEKFVSNPANRRKSFHILIIPFFIIFLIQIGIVAVIFIGIILKFRNEAIHGFRNEGRGHEIEMVRLPTQSAMIVPPTASAETLCTDPMASAGSLSTDTMFSGGTLSSDPTMASGRTLSTYRMVSAGTRSTDRRASAEALSTPPMASDETLSTAPMAIVGTISSEAPIASTETLSTTSS